MRDLKILSRSRMRAAGAFSAFAFIVALTAPNAGFDETTGPQAPADSATQSTDATSSHATDPLAATQASFDGALDSLAASVAHVPVAPSEQELHPVPVTAAQQTFTPTHEQLANAKEIVDAGKAMGLPPRAWTIAVATSLQESNLRNLGHLGARNDHDSLGLFQQRPSSGWGTPAQVTDPAYASTAFYNGLVRIPGWDSLPLTRAAQKVQVSAYPNHYAKHEAQAGAIIEALYGAGPSADLAPAVRGAPAPVGAGVRPVRRPAVPVRFALVRTLADPADLTGRGALARALRAALPAVGGYTVVRAIGLVVLAIDGSRTGRSLLDLLTGWDAGWYIGIADHGYDTSISYRDDGTLVNTNIAFFPLFGWLIRAVSVLAIPSDVAAVIVANVAGLAAAWGIFVVGRRLADARVGVLLAVLWGALPHAIVLNMGYTESLFTALCAWGLWAVLERRLVLAGALAALAGLTRPTAAALIVAVGVACGLAIRRDGGWRPWVGLVLAPAGLVGYVVWCGVAVGRADAYFWMQSRGWEQRFDFGWTTLHELGVTAIHRSPLGMYVTGLVLVATVGLFALLVADNRTRWRETLPVLLFAGVLLATVLVQGGNYWYAKARFLLPAFPVLLPLATRLVTARVWVRATTIGVLVAVSAAYGAYLLVTWPLSP